MATSLKLKGLLAKAEATYGVDPTPAIADNGVQVEEGFWNSITVDFDQENLREGLAQRSMGRAGLGAPSGELATIEVVVALKGCGAAFADPTELPEWDPLHLACGHARTVDATPGSETVTYKLASSAHSSATLWVYAGGLLFKVSGCRGSVVELWNPGQYILARYTFRGLVGSVTQVTVPVIVYAQKAVSPPPVKNASMQLNSFAPADFSSWELNLGIALAARPGGNATGGHAGFEVADYNPMIRTTIDRPVLASLDPYALRRAGTLFPWTIGVIGTTQYNRLKRSGPKGRMISTPHSDEEGLAMMDLEVRAQHTDEETADDAVELLLT